MFTDSAPLDMKHSMNTKTPTLKRQSLLIIIVSLSLSLLTACKEKLDIIDGNIPPEFVPAAQTYLGSYGGHFRAQSNELTLELEGTQVILAAKNDLIRSQCHSMIGKLKRLSIYKKTKTIAKAVFEFDSNFCPEVQGTELQLHFSKKDPHIVTASLYYHEEIRWECNTYPGGYPHSPYPGYPMSPNCRIVFFPVYLEGQFVRH